MNPNSFVTIKGKHRLRGVIRNIERIMPWKDIKHIEKVEPPSKKCAYWLKFDSDNRQTIVQCEISRKTYDKLKSQLTRVDFDIPIIEVQEQIKEMVQEEMAKSKRVNSAIASLDIMEVE